MKINKINTIYNVPKFNGIKKFAQSNSKNIRLSSGNYLECLARYNKINFTGEHCTYSLMLSSKELEERTDDNALTKYILLDENSPEYQGLAEGDKKALAHLVRAGVILGDVFLRQDNEHNIPVKKYLQKESQEGNLDAAKTLDIFTSQTGVCGVDYLMQEVNLISGIKPTLGKGFYPEDLDKDEFHEILLKMLRNGEVDEVRKILSQRTMVVRDKDKLKGIDYTEFFRNEFKNAADELMIAAETSTNDKFNEFLIHQANALKSYNPNEDALADIIWASMQDTPLEFTIVRESYSDELTKTIPENPELSELLEKNNIEPLVKDAIGVRVGIVNKKGTEYILKVKDFLPLMAANMPYCNQYKQTISDNSEILQTMVDADIVLMTGDSATIRTGIVIAENLPNDDKDSLKLGGGRRNVYHRQIRLARESDGAQLKLSALLNPDQHQYYHPEASHKFVIGHENMHTLGPKENLDKLGTYKNLIEEMKADTGSIGMLDLLVKKEFYTEEEKKQIVLAMVLDSALKSKPPIEQTHRAANLIEFNYLLRNGAFKVDKNGIITIDFDKSVQVAYQMLEELISIQLSQDLNEADAFVRKYYYWSDENQSVATNLNKVNKKLSGKLISPLADKLMNE